MKSFAEFQTELKEKAGATITKYKNAPHLTGVERQEYQRALTIQLGQMDVRETDAAIRDWLVGEIARISE